MIWRTHWHILSFVTQASALAVLAVGAFRAGWFAPMPIEMLHSGLLLLILGNVYGIRGGRS